MTWRTTNRERMRFDSNGRGGLEGWVDGRSPSKAMLDDSHSSSTPPTIPMMRGHWKGIDDEKESETYLSLKNLSWL